MVCSYDVAEIDVRLFLKDDKGEPYARLGRLRHSLKSKPMMLMNGGMYHDDLGAVGLYVERGVEAKTISTKGGWGNFHLLPNGVFWARAGKLGVTETKTFLKRGIKTEFATQSGPMLVIDGKLHPRFLKTSDSLKTRNGVGISRDGSKVHFVLSKRGVNFWNFAELFRKELGAHNALFLDGTVSAINAEGFNLGGWRALGPMIGVFEKR